MICANQPQPRIIQLYFSLQMNTWWKLTRGEDILCSSLRQMQSKILLQIQNPTEKKNIFPAQCYQERGHVWAVS